MASRKFPIPILVIFAFFTSFASMSYELVIAQTLASLTDEVIWWESLSIGFFIASTGLGIFLFDKLVHKRVLSFFLKAEALLALTGLLALPFIFLVHIFYRIYIVDYVGHGQFFKPLNWIMLTCQVPNIFIGILSGFELRMLFKLLSVHETEESTRSQIFVLVIYHFGALLASLVFAAVLSWKIDPFQLAFFSSVLNASVCVYVLLHKYLRTYKDFLPYGHGLGIGFLSLFFFYVFFHFAWKSLKEVQIKNFYYNKISGRIEDGVFEQTGPVSLWNLKSWAAELPAIERRFSPYQVIDLVRSLENEKEWKLFLDGHFQFSSETERFYHETLAHVPIMLTESVPRRTLVLGGGDGLLVRELLKYENRIERIDLVELDREILALAKSLPFSSLNGNSLSHSSVHLSVADAFSWLRLSQNQFDAIYIDFPYPYTFEGLRLYSAEFFSLAARHLASDGFLIMDIPAFGAGDPEWKEHVSSLLRRSGFSKLLAFEGSYGETFVLGMKKKRALPFVFRDMGIHLETLTPKWFASEGNRMDLASGDLREINSILKPKRISLPDVWK